MKRRPFKLGALITNAHHTNLCNLGPLKDGTLFATAQGRHIPPLSQMIVLGLKWVPCPFSNPELSRKERLEWSLWYAKVMWAGKIAYVPLTEKDFQVA